MSKDSKKVNLYKFNGQSSEFEFIGTKYIEDYKERSIGFVVERSFLHNLDVNKDSSDRISKESQN